MTQTNSMTQTDPAASEIRPFRIDFPDAALDDLKRRIAATNWPERETVADASQGVRLDDDSGARPLLGHGARLAEGGGAAERLPQFVTVIDGLDIHFIQVRLRGGCA